MGKRAGCGRGGERAGDEVKGRAAVPGSVLGDGVPRIRRRGPGATEVARCRGKGALPAQDGDRQLDWTPTRPGPPRGTPRVPVPFL